MLVALVQIALAQKSLNVMTFNIRLNVASDSLNAWPYRKDKASSQILFHKADVVGVQEALYGQMMDLQQLLPQYAYAGVGRDDGKQKGEYSAIFYNKARLQLLKTETFWLSEHPEVAGSKSWDAAITRVVTWAQFKDRKTKKKFYVFNTHFDHIGKVARAESAKLIERKVAEIAGNAPVIITGDFNTTPQEEPIKILVDKANPLHFTNTIEVTQQPHYGPTGTFTGFQSKETSNEPIDHIFIKNGWKVLQHATLSQSWQGRFSSDHFPVFAVLVL